MEGNSGGTAILSGKYRGTDVTLGHIRSFEENSLIFTGGYGKSASLSDPPAPIGISFYNNPDWFDDVCDGLITADLTLANGDIVEVESAWVIVAPPDFSPASNGLVTLYDLIYQVALSERVDRTNRSDIFRY